jgi:predicted DNA-binding antitoxin AbrB/MazE fold protein
MTIAVDAIYENGVLKPKTPVDLPDKAEVRLTIETAETSRTPLGKDLRELKARVVESGVPLLDWDEIETEVASRRGGWREPR